MAAQGREAQRLRGDGPGGHGGTPSPLQHDGPVGVPRLASFGARVVLLLALRLHPLRLRQRAGRKAGRGCASHRDALPCASWAMHAAAAAGKAHASAHPVVEGLDVGVQRLQGLPQDLEDDVWVEWGSAG